MPNDRFSTRIKDAWNVFRRRSAEEMVTYDLGPSYAHRSDRIRYSSGGERTTIQSIYTRLAMDVSDIDFRHVQNDQNGNYESDRNSHLNYCLSEEANIDQSAVSFIRDAVYTMFEEGVIAIVPVITTLNPDITGGFDIKNLRVGRVREWMARHVRVDLWDDDPKYGGRNREVVVPKATTAIVENPLYTVMNEPNSTLQRLIRKISLLDQSDEEFSAGKLDIIIQLPYVIKSEARQQQAEKRRKDIEAQLTGSKYGIAYTDGTERITQLNRAAENNLLPEIERLTAQCYHQLGLSESVFAGTATEEEMTNYYNRTVLPIARALSTEMNRSFLTKTARTQKQAITYFRDPLKLVSATAMAEIADKFTRNEILTPNEIRTIIGRKPSDNPMADELLNRNLNHARGGENTEVKEPEEEEHGV